MKSERFPKSKHAGNFKVQSPIPHTQAGQMIMSSGAIARPSRGSVPEKQSRAFACITGGLDHVEAPNLQSGK
jgi:hypothetical protein